LFWQLSRRSPVMVRISKMPVIYGLISPLQH
jgi:hypothetical protein